VYRVIAAIVVQGSTDAPISTKKNSQRIIKLGKFSKVLPSKPFIRFQDNCVIDGWDGTTITDDVAITVRIFPPKAIGDIDGYLASLLDVMQHYRVLANDRQVKRLLDVEIMSADRAQSRFEVEIYSYQKPSHR
jgi:Holliday junction resolvase RusA-like endonuclease